MHQPHLIPHLFRTEFSKITAVLCRHFGIGHIQLAEDIASETFLSAIETWPYKGIPENPEAWLYKVAKNKAINHLNRHHIFSEKIAPGIKNDTAKSQTEDIDLSEKNITDSKLQMLFAICHPSISKEAQVGLALRILCGFGIDEIATAFLTSKETINKRLFRAREKLRIEKAVIEFPPPSEIFNRLDPVLTIIYLLFNEGCYSENVDTILRKDLCLEAMHLCYLLIQNEQTNLPAVNALMSLMCFHASRFDARTKQNGEIVLYEDQDETLWNTDLITKGAYYLHQASSASVLSKYHLEAGIAYWHTQKNDTKEKWEHILQLYNILLKLEYSPIAALNRTYALAKANGKETAIKEAEKLKLTDNPYYYTLLGTLYTDTDNQLAKSNYQKALQLAKTSFDRKVIQKKIDALCER